MIEQALAALAETIRQAAVALSPAAMHPCPNCGALSDFCGIYHDCFSKFEKTEGGWPAWEEAKKRWATEGLG